MTAERVAQRIAHPTLDYKAIDVDNHYYETVDSCTRHLPKEFKRRGVQMVADGKRTLAVMGEVVNHFIPNPTFDPIIEPGCLDLLFRGEIPEGVDPDSLMKVDRMADHPEYQNRDARVKVLDRQNLETVFMLPTFACGVEEALKHDIEATMASVHAFNLWLDDDWGFDRPDGRNHIIMHVAESLDDVRPFARRRDFERLAATLPPRSRRPQKLPGREDPRDLPGRKICIELLDLRGSPGCGQVPGTITRLILAGRDVVGCRVEGRGDGDRSDGTLHRRGSLGVHQNDDGREHPGTILSWFALKSAEHLPTSRGCHSPSRSIFRTNWAATRRAAE